MMDREGMTLPWRDLLRALRRLEARGEICGGRFVSGGSGEQFDLVEEVGELADDLEGWDESASFEAIKEAVRSACQWLFKQADDKSGRVVVIADVNHFVIIHETESDLLQPTEFAKQIAW
jgi:hypothetical protein